MVTSKPDQRDGSVAFYAAEELKNLKVVSELPDSLFEELLIRIRSNIGGVVKPPLVIEEKNPLIPRNCVTSLDLNLVDIQSIDGVFKENIVI